MLLSSLRKKISPLLSDECARGAYISIFIIYCLYSSVVFLHYHAMVPDEIWFLNAAKHVDLFGAAAAYLNYGAIYWALLKLLASAFVARLFFLVLFLSIPIWIIASLKSEKTRLLVLLLYLTFPFSFWSGKLIGPEILVVFLVSAAIFLLNKDKKIVAAILLGIAAGIKITAVPLVALLAINVAGKNKYFKLVFALYTFLAGMWLANLFNLFDYIGMLLLTSSVQHSMAAFNSVHLARTEWTWDSVLIGSLSAFIMHPLLLTAVLLVSIYKIPKIAIPCAIAILGTSAMIITSPVKYGWYWFSIIPVVLYCIGMLLDSSIKSESINRIDSAKITITVFVLLANFFFNISYTTLQMGQKAEQIKVIEAFPKSRHCLQKLIDKYQPKYIIDELEFSDPSLFSSDLHTPKGTIMMADHNITSPLDPPFDMTGKKLKIPTDPTMVLIGSRLLENKYTFQNLATKKGDALYFYGNCGDFSVFTNSLRRN